MRTTGQSRREHFFSVVDGGIDAISVRHREYPEKVRHYFYTLFPARQRLSLTDPVTVPLPINIELLRPSATEPFYVVHTLGMSAAPMLYPPDTDEASAQLCSYSELCLLLPADWPFTDPQHIRLDEPAAWPLRMLQDLAKFPHLHHLWMSYGFLLPNAEDGRPFAPDTELCGVFIVQFEGELGELHLEDGTSVQLLMPVLVYQDEMDRFDSLGFEHFAEELLEAAGDSFILKLNRPHIAGKAAPL